MQRGKTLAFTHPRLALAGVALIVRVLYFAATTQAAVPSTEKKKHDEERRRNRPRFPTCSSEFARAAPDAKILVGR